MFFQDAEIFLFSSGFIYLMNYRIIILLLLSQYIETVPWVVVRFFLIYANYESVDFSYNTG